MPPNCARDESVLERDGTSTSFAKLPQGTNRIAPNTPGYRSGRCSKTVPWNSRLPFQTGANLERNLMTNEIGVQFWEPRK